MNQCYLYSFSMQFHISAPHALPAGAWGGISMAFVLMVVAGFAAGLLIGTCCGHRLKNCFSYIVVSIIMSMFNVSRWMTCSVRLQKYDVDIVCMRIILWR